MVRPARLAWLCDGSACVNLIFRNRQFFIVMAASCYVLGIMQRKNDTEPERYVDFGLTAAWVRWLTCFIDTITRRQRLAECLLYS
jgi:cbb3-type cytochrome oxidase subunit 1